MFHKLNNIAIYSPVAIEEVKRIKLYYSFLEKNIIQPAESLVLKRLHGRLHEFPGLIIDNIEIPKYGDNNPPITFNIKGCQEILELLGEKPLTLE